MADQQEKPPLWQKLIAPAVGLALLAPMVFLLRARLVSGSDLEATHRAYLDAYVADLHAGRSAQPGADMDASIAHLAHASSWEVRDVQLGAGFDGRGDSCWSIETVSPAGQRVGIVLGISDDDGPIRIAGWGMQPKCRCPRKTGGSLRC